MDIDSTSINRAKNLVEEQLDQPILKIAIIPGYREPLAKFLCPGMRVLDVAANNRSLKTYLEIAVGWSFLYKSMDIDSSYRHDYNSLG